MARRMALLLLTVALATGLAACGGDDDDDGSDAVTVTNGQIEIEARDVRFSVKEINTAAGPLAITLVDKGNLEHTFVLEDADGTMLEPKLDVSSADEDSGTFDLTTGEYVFYCDIPGHRGQGMEGTITVE